MNPFFRSVTAVGKQRGDTFPDRKVEWKDDYLLSISAMLPSKSMNKTSMKGFLKGALITAQDSGFL
jgi:hypothetical protein